MMGKKFLLEKPEQIEALAKKLNMSLAVTKFDKPGEPQAWTLAYALSDLERSFILFVDDYLPRLINSPENDSEDILLDIGEEIRHILYHIRDLEIYRYLIE
jgi:hypothetical protein